MKLLKSKSPWVVLIAAFVLAVPIVTVLAWGVTWAWTNLPRAEADVGVQVLAPGLIDEEAVAAMQIGYDQQVNNIRLRQTNPLGLPPDMITETLRGGSPLPELAIMLGLHDLVAEGARAWKAKGVEPSENVFRCPSSGDRIYIEHGDRVACRCGVHFELYGNGLAMWRETPDESVAGRRRRQE